MIVEVLDNLLAPIEKEVETDDVGVDIVTSSESYGSYLLNEFQQQQSQQQDDVIVTGENISM